MALEESELTALQEGIAEVVAAECGSLALHDCVDGKNDLEARMWRHAAELGWLSIGVAESNGGLGLGAPGLAVLHRELGRRLVPGPYIATLAAAQWIERFGDDAVKKRVLAPMLAGELSIAIPASLVGAEPGLQVRAGVLSGRVPALLGSPLSRFAVIRLGRDEWALVEVDGAKARLTSRRSWDPTRTLCDLECDDAKALLTANGPQVAGQLAQSASLAVIFDSIGAAEAIHLQTVDYLQTRVQFERPLASFQALKHRAADLKISYDVARHVAGQALAALDGPDAGLWADVGKASVTDAFAFIAADCLQLHGGVGFTWAFDCHLYLKRAKLNQALVGSNEAQTDQAFDGMVAAMTEGRSMLEISL